MEQVAQDHFQAASEGLQGRDSTTFGQHLSVFWYPHSAYVLAGVQGKTPVLQFVHIFSCPVLFCSHPSGFFRHQWDSEPSFSRMKIPTLSAFPYSRDSPIALPSLWFFVRLSSVWSYLPWIEKSKTGHSIPGVTSPGLEEGKDHFPPSACWQYFV